MSNGFGAGEGAPRPAGRGAGLSAEISQRVSSILDAVEEEAARVRAEARADAEAEIERAREQADRLVQERRQRIAELSDELVAKTEAILGRLDDAEPIYRRFDRLIHALGEAAEKLASEAGETETVEEVVQPTETVSADPPIPEPSPAGPDPAAPAPASGAPAAEDDPYVSPRSSSFWRAARTGTAPAPPPASTLAARDERDDPLRPPANLDAARAAAFQLATRGASREEVENHLRVMHDLEDPGPLLDETFAALEQRAGRREQT